MLVESKTSVINTNYFIVFLFIATTSMVVVTIVFLFFFQTAKNASLMVY